jgi:hypothetical protein
MHEHIGSGDAGATGDLQVDEALARLTALADLPVHEHATVVEAVHQVLQDRLASQDQSSLGHTEG